MARFDTVRTCLPYEVFKVQVRESNVEGVELGDCETGSYPLVINGEKGG